MKLYFIFVHALEAETFVQALRGIAFAHLERNRAGNVSRLQAVSKNYRELSRLQHFFTMRVMVMPCNFVVERNTQRSPLTADATMDERAVVLVATSTADIATR